MSATLHPTGTCFEDVTMFFAKLIQEDKTRIIQPNFCMVHGICKMPDGKKFSHAWVEDGKEVWFSGILRGNKGFALTTRRDFYKKYRVQEFTRYNFRDLMELSKTVGNAPPPWEEKYRRLCKDYKQS